MLLSAKYTSPSASKVLGMGPPFCLAPSRALAMSSNALSLFWGTPNPYIFNSASIRYPTKANSFWLIVSSAHFLASL